MNYSEIKTNLALITTLITALFDYCRMRQYENEPGYIRLCNDLNSKAEYALEACKCHNTPDPNFKKFVEHADIYMRAESGSYDSAWGSFIDNTDGITPTMWDKYRELVDQM